MVTPLVTQQIEDFAVSANSNNSTFDLSTNFDDPSTTGRVARFEFADNIDNGGVTDVLLFDQSGVGAPATVTNFLNYVEDGDYDNSIIHRSVPEFIIQGGGFTVDNAEVVDIPADDPVVNEFNAARSNLRGTIAMAKLGNDPDSATNQWFFNLADNSENLDNQNGGFTAFGQVLNGEDLEPIDAIADLPIANGGGALSTIPITDTTPPINTEDYVYLESISLITEDELEFSVVENTNDDLVSATVNDGELVLDYAPNQSGEAIITLEATNLLGESVEDRFLVTVEPEPETPNGEMTNEETSDTETPDTETPNEEMNGDETPNTETQTPDGETSDTETPNGEMTNEETSDTETPDTETPNGEMNGDETPNTETQTLDEETSDIETPNGEETPLMEMPVTDTPDTEPPNEDTSDTNTDTDTDTAVFRFLDLGTGIHFYATSEAEREQLEATQPDYISEPLGYRTLDSLTGNPEAVELFIFFNEDTGASLYTSDRNEIAFIEANLPNYSLEEEPLFAFDSQQPDTIPVHRFLNTNTGAHFYTASETERESIDSGLSNYEYEGIEFYALEV